ncbi:LysR family transcriptional regulator [Variovorax sp. LjRoot290]|uniref:LysR family transcriptional regulator n=1 Tax=Variovorax sp. LjRoot290 TaxID=3342316 RepID=UPI003ED0A682
MVPDLLSLTLLRLAVQHGSLSKAAAQMHLALSAASRRISLLEHQFGIALFHRLPGGGLEPTAAGTAAAFHAGELSAEVERLTQTLAEFAAGVKGNVRVVGTPSAMSQKLPQQLQAFGQRQPRVRIEIREAQTASIIKALRDGTADVGVIMEGLSTAGLETRPYGTDTLCALLPPDHPLQARRTAFAALLDDEIIGLGRGAALTRLLERAAQEAGKPLKLTVQVQSYEAVCRMVESGRGIGVLPRGAAWPYLDALAIRAVDIEDAWARRRMLVCLRPGATDASLRAIADFLACPSDGEDPCSLSHDAKRRLPIL